MPARFHTNFVAEVDSTNEGVCNAGLTICSAHLDAVRQTVDCRVLPSEGATALQSLFTNYSLARCLVSFPPPLEA